jgi:hypothetical protein
MARTIRKNRTYDFALFRTVLLRATFSCDYGVAIGTTDFAFAYFGFDYQEGVTVVNHVGDVVLFVGQVVKL